MCRDTIDDRKPEEGEQQIDTSYMTRTRTHTRGVIHRIYTCRTRAVCVDWFIYIGQHTHLPRDIVRSQKSNTDARSEAILKDGYYSCCDYPGWVGYLMMHHHLAGCCSPPPFIFLRLSWVHEEAGADCIAFSIEVYYSFACAMMCARDNPQNSRCSCISYIHAFSSLVLSFCFVTLFHLFCQLCAGRACRRLGGAAVSPSPTSSSSSSSS